MTVCNLIYLLIIMYHVVLCTTKRARAKLFILLLQNLKIERREIVAFRVVTLEMTLRTKRRD